MTSIKERRLLHYIFYWSWAGAPAPGCVGIIVVTIVAGARV